ncbi:MAG: hypothetical protein K0Q73_7675 [Paenibacillus sp.]|nr:hypothetical protein [Paenibacillus sp.]
MSISQKYKDQFKRLKDLQIRVNHVHPLLHNYYPIAIVEEGNINIFDYNKNNKQFVLKHVEKDYMNIPMGVRAAFPLECYENRSVVVVTGEVFESIANQIIVFHEYVHCYQFETCEMKLRSQIELAQRSVNTKDYFWELQYPFPYEDTEFVKYVNDLFKALVANDRKELCILRQEIKAYLTSEQVEYMVWQEWKEGFARYIENVIKREMGVKENHFGVNQPYSRPLLYETGSCMAGFLYRNKINDLQDIEELYFIMSEDKW